MFVVADGMGGHAAGEVASRIAVETVLQTWVGGSVTRPSQALRTAARAANTAVFAASMDRERRGMGTTLVSLALVAGEAFIANVGDSRAYHVRRGVCSQLTTDHSRVGEMLRMRLITPEQAAHHPARSQLTRSLGGEPAVQVDLVHKELAVGDVFVLCSDGLWDLVSRRDIAEATEAVPDEAAEALIDSALQRGAPDNVSAIVVRITEGHPIAPERPQSFLSRLGRRLR
jgi:protein phosphatase